MPTGRPPKKKSTSRRKPYQNPFHKQIFEEWRGLPQEEPSADRAELIASTVTAILADMGLKERLDEQEIAATWKEIVGEFLAMHSKPLHFKDGCLVVRVSQPTVHYELDRVWKKKILANLQERFGQQKIREVRFQC